MNFARVVKDIPITHRLETGVIIRIWRNEHIAHDLVERGFVDTRNVFEGGFGGRYNVLRRVV